MSLETEAEVREVWSSGSYAQIAPNYLPMAGQLVDRTDLGSGDDVLDVGCGTGSVAISAARRDADVVGLDITPSMLDRAAENAALAGTTDIEWREGAATNLPFGDDSFDVTLSSLGHMYGDPPDATKRELHRVTRPGGRVAFTSWTPLSLYPALGGILATRLSAGDMPGFSEPPFMWGDRDTVERRLDDGFEDVQFDRECLSYPALSPAHFWEELVETSGMFATFLEKVDDRGGIREPILDRIDADFDPVENAVELEYLLTSATVTESDR